MLPCIFPPFPERSEFDIYASMLPAKEIGGDFYDFYLMDEDNLAVTIADVSGKGVPAALFMVIAKILLRNSASGGGPGAVFAAVNNKLCENNDTQMFATAFMGYYNIPSGRFIYVNAGHNPPFMKKAGKDYEFLKTTPSLVLGFMKDTVYTEEEITLAPGDALYLYTDGVTEAMNAERDFFSEQRLLEALNNNRESQLKDLLSAIKREIDAFAGEAEQADDITMLALEIGQTPEAPGPEAAMKELRIEASRDRINEVMDFVTSELTRHNCPPELQNGINVSVEETFSNIANYAYTPAKGDALIGISVGDEAIIRFEDMGRPFNPLEQAAPDLDKPIMEREIGGLGIYLTRKLMDRLDYERLGDKNVLTIYKKITGSKQQITRLP